MGSLARWIVFLYIGWCLGSVGVAESRKDQAVTFRLVNLEILSGFVSDSTPKVSSEDCAGILEVEYRGRDDIYVDPVAIGLEPGCGVSGERRLFLYDQICDEIVNAEGYCDLMQCEDMQKFTVKNVPFSNPSSRFFMLHESNYTKGRVLSAFLMEDTPPGDCEPFLESIQGGDQPRLANSTGTRTLLSGDIMVVRVARDSVIEKECLYVSENRRGDDRYTVSHRVRVDDNERDEVEGTEKRFQDLWAAKVGIQSEAVVAEFTEDAQARMTFLELHASKLSSAKATLLTQGIIRSDVMGVALKVRPSFGQSFSPDGMLWYRVDGGGFLTVVLGGWVKVGSFDPVHTAVLGIICVLPVVVLLFLFVRYRKKRHGYMPASAYEVDFAADSMLDDEDDEDEEAGPSGEAPN